MTTPKKGTKQKEKPMSVAKPGPGRQRQANPDNEAEGPLRIVLPASLLQFLDEKQKGGLSRAAYVANLLRREMNREKIFRGKSDLELFFTWLSEDIEKGQSPEDLQGLAEAGQRFVRKLKKLEAKVYTN